MNALLERLRLIGVTAVLAACAMLFGLSKPGSAEESPAPSATPAATPAPAEPPAATPPASPTAAPVHANAAVGCQSCHACPEPTPENPCLLPCQRDRDTQFRKAIEEKGVPQGVIILDMLSDEKDLANQKDHYGPVPFDHGGHARWAEISGGCTVCHHYTPEGAQHPKCSSCHEIEYKHEDLAKPGLKGAFHRQCMNCHREWSHETSCDVCHLPRFGPDGKTPNGAQVTPDDILGRMHPPIPAPKIETYQTAYPEGGSTVVHFDHERHAETYHLACAECHKGDSCARCHEYGKQHTQHVRTLDEHHQPCGACHVIEDRCSHCHTAPDAPAPPPFDHASTGWPLATYHARLSCRDCHKQSPFQALDRNCASCHGSWDPDEFNHAATGQALDDTHREIGCGECHEGEDFTKPPTCTACHDADEGFVVPNKRPGPKAGS